MKDLLLLHRRMQESTGKGRRRRDSHPQRGVIKSGSCTDKVLAVIVAEHPRAIGRAEIVIKSECAPKSVDWALFYLKSISRISCQSAFDNRSPLYLRYKLVGGE